MKLSGLKLTPSDISAWRSWTGATLPHFLAFHWPIFMDKVPESYDVTAHTTAVQYKRLQTYQYDFNQRRCWQLEE
jgi:hypothetical protein